MIDTLKHMIKLAIKPEYRSYTSQVKELNKIKLLPRYTETLTSILGPSLKIVDAASFVFMFQEIFQKEIYKFTSGSKDVYIIDGGANIGLSILYFKKCFPDAEIVGFEPDGKVYEALKYNVNSFGLSNIRLVKKALWFEETFLSFFAEGADGGTLFTGDKKGKIEVPTERLRSYLTKPVDLLKLDIEGAETEVLCDCEDLLYHVKKLFVEYHSFVDQPQTLNKIINLLTRTGFRLHIHPGGLFSEQPFVSRRVDYNMDLQLNIFAFRD